MKLKNNSVGKTTYWFCENGMRANQDKYYFVSSLDMTTKPSLTDSSIDSSKC